MREAATTVRRIACALSLPSGVTSFSASAQQPCLQMQRHVADLVEEQGAAVGLAIRPFMPLLRPPVNAPAA